MRTVRFVSITALTLAALLMTGCGYTVGGLHRTDVKTISVPMWTRGPNVFRRELEQRLTEAIVKRLQMDTHYKIAPRKTADTELSGQIVSISQRVLSMNTDTGSPREKEMTFVVNFTWSDLRTGKVLVDQVRFSASGKYIEDDAFKQTDFEGSETVIDRIAQRIVEKLENKW